MENQKPVFLAEVISSFTQEAISQENKGIPKYGRPLDPFQSKFEWLQMAREELVDCFKYLECEQAVKTQVISKAINDLGSLVQDMSQSSVTVKSAANRLTTIMQELDSYLIGKQGE